MKFTMGGKPIDNSSKKKADLNSVFTVLCLSLAFVLTILLSFGARFLFRPTFDSAFWGDLAVSASLCVYCLYFGVPEGRNAYQKKEGGRYQNCVNSFKGVRENVAHNDFAFTQWLQRYYEKNRTDFFKAVLSSHGNINSQVLDLDVHEIEQLRNPYKKDWSETEFKGRKVTYFRSLDDKQMQIVRNIFSGRINFARIPDDFFKTLNGKVVTSEYARQAEANKKHTLGYVMMILGRLVLIFAIAFVFNAFALQVSKAESGEEVLQRTVSTISRIWTMASSFVYGFSLGRIMVMDDCATIEYKARVNKEFLDDKDFKPISEEEEAKRQYEEYERKKEEAKANVITPEVSVSNAIALPYNKEEEMKGSEKDGQERILG